MDIFEDSFEEEIEAYLVANASKRVEDNSEERKKAAIAAIVSNI